MNEFTKHFYIICPSLSSIYLYISKPYYYYFCNAHFQVSELTHRNTFSKFQTVHKPKNFGIFNNIHCFITSQSTTDFKWTFIRAEWMLKCFIIQILGRIYLQIIYFHFHTLFSLSSSVPVSYIFPLMATHKALSFPWKVKMIIS